MTTNISKSASSNGMIHWKFGQCNKHLNKFFSGLPMMRNKLNGIEQIHNCQHTNGMYTSLRNNRNRVSVLVRGIMREKERESVCVYDFRLHEVPHVKWRRINFLYIHFNRDHRFGQIKKLSWGYLMLYLGAIVIYNTET